MVEFTDREDIRRWLYSRPSQLGLALATRSAIRMLPRIAEDSDETFQVLALPGLRAVLLATVNAADPSGSEQLRYLAGRAGKSAAHAAASAEWGARNSISKALGDAIQAGNAAADAAAAARYPKFDSTIANTSETFLDFPEQEHRVLTAAVEFDAEELDSSASAIETFRTPLWPADTGGKPWADFAKPLLDAFDADPAIWGFWAQWYEGMLSGNPLPWDLQEAVALIPDEDWKAGPARVAEVIRGIEFAHRTAVDRRAVFDPTSGKFQLEPASELPVSTLAFARDRIEMALENALNSGTANGLTEESYETRVIRGVIEGHPEDGSLLAVSFFDACMSFQRTIGDVYPEDASLIILKHALYTTCEEITELDPNAKARVKRLVALGRPSIIPAPEREEVAEIPGYVADLTDEELQARIQEATDIVANSEKPPSSVRARLTNWITTITIWMDKTMKGDKRLTWLAKQVERMRGWWDGLE